MNVRIYQNSKEQFCFYVSNSATDRFRVPSSITNQVDAEEKRIQLEKLLPLSKKQVTIILNGGNLHNTNKNLFSIIFENFLRKTDLEAQWTYNTLKHFEGLKTKINDHWGHIYIEDMCNEDWLYSYVSYRQTAAINTTIAKEVKSLKQFFRYVHKIGLCDCSSLINAKVRLKKASKPNVIYLTKDELKKLETCEFGTDYLTKTRDIFLFSSMTGLRYSDAQSIGKSNLIGRTIRFTTQKTDDTLNIPLNDVAFNILAKYDYKLPRISNQVLNRFVKEMCKQAGIDHPTTIIHYRGCKRIEVTKPKYELVSTHSARKSFVSNLLMSGVPIPVIMRMTGHSSYDVMKCYVGVDDFELTSAVNKICYI